MPIYEYQCRYCTGEWTEVTRKIDERDVAPICAVCLGQMELRISAVHGFVKNPAAGRKRRV